MIRFRNIGVFLLSVLLLPMQCEKEPESVQPRFISVPDPFFMAALTEGGYDLNGDGKISVSEAEEISHLEIGDRGIYDLTGLEAMVNLENLQCYNNMLKSIDLSGNPFLQTLDCSGNRLESLDLSRNPYLNFLDCRRNRIVDLNVTQNRNLLFLWCGSNQIERLDLSQNQALGSAWDCSGEFCSDEIDLSFMPGLIEVCVWCKPFPPDKNSVCVNCTGSPNIYFTTRCLTAPSAE